VQTLTEILLFLSVVLGLWWLYFYGYRQLVIDNTRQRLFFIRDRLFDQARDGHIDFNAPAYGMLRLTLNGMIQYAHDFSLVSWLSLRYAEKRFGAEAQGRRYGEAFATALKELQHDDRLIVEETMRDMHITIVKHVIYRSLLLTLVFLALRAISRVRRFVDQTIKAWGNDSSMFVIDSAAESIGSGSNPDHLAAC
jgi:hypothetical protein